MDADFALAQLAARLADIPRLAVAVSGGIDSVTLAVAAHRLRPGAVEMFHAASPAVPADAGPRITAIAALEGWQLHVIDAGELRQEQYVANPVNRCLYCKRALYDRIGAHTDAQVLSGANLDDLGDYRPGLVAASEAAVRHPYIEAGIDKATVRRLARSLGLGDLAELPSSPCLSSRVETGIRIAVPTLRGIDRAERYLREATGSPVVRCRVRRQGVVIEVDEGSLAAMDAARRDEVARSVRSLIDADADASNALPVFDVYRRGSAFVGDRT